MDKVDMIYTKDAPADFQPYMVLYESLFEVRAQRERKKPLAQIAAFGGAFVCGVALFTPSIPQPIPALALIAAICGALWLHFNRQNELQTMKSQLDIEYFFKAKGFTIIQIPAVGTSIFPNP